MSFPVLSPTAILGYGFPLSSFMKGMEMNPNLIAVDAGSTAPGPYYLGSGKPFTNRTGVKRDLRYILKEGIPRGIPVVIGTAGGSGAKSHVDWCRNIIRETASEEGLRFTLSVIYADIDKKIVAEKLSEGTITPLQGAPQVSPDELKKIPNIVAQMGIEPIQEALERGAQVVLCGRAYDPAVFAALPIQMGYDPGLAIHMGKILECAAIAAEPGSGSDSVIGKLDKESFTLIPLSAERKFTSRSTAAHTLYEKSDPYHLLGPGGMLNLEKTAFSDNGDGTVTVRGSRFETSDRYVVKLEGAKKAGFRCLSIAGIRDKILINQIEAVLKTVETRIKETLHYEGIRGTIYFKIYGKNGVMGDLEHMADSASRGHELCVIIETLGPSQHEADTICSLARSTLLHYGYPGRISTAGNLAFPFSPSDIPMGEAYEFALYHLLPCNPKEHFPIHFLEVP